MRIHSIIIGQYSSSRQKDSATRKSVRKFDQEGFHFPICVPNGRGETKFDRHTAGGFGTHPQWTICCWSMLLHLDSELQAEIASDRAIVELSGAA